MKQADPIRLKLLYTGVSMLLVALITWLVGVIFGLEGVKQSSWSLGGAALGLVIISGIGFAIYGKVRKASKPEDGSSNKA